MGRTALYQKYRSSTFEEVIGQDYIVRSIKNAVRENKVGHAYLFCGPRGTGKTTMARLLAKAVNCQNPDRAPCNECPDCIAANEGTHPDIIEINAANETHVDDIRELIDRSTLAPMQGKYKVYIIDEVHQLSSAASSALLKTLEEPPENVIFILATTDPQKLLPTIISRCQRFDFSKVRTDLIQKHLLDIAKKENIEMEPEAAEMIAVLADGGMRDSLSIMDQCAAYTSDHITAEDVNRIYGLTTVAEKIALLKDILHKDIASLIKKIQSYEKQGIDLQRFTDGMTDILKDRVVYGSTKDASLLKLLNAEQAEDLAREASASECMKMAEKMLTAGQKFRTSSSTSSAFEVLCLSLASEEPSAETQSASASKVKRPDIPVSAPDEKKPEIKEEPEPEVKTVPVREYTEDEILKLLVQCNKTEKQKDEEIFSRMSLLAQPEEKKYTTLLEETQIAASGKDCLIVVSHEQAPVHEINDPDMNQKLYFFLKNHGIDKMIYAVDQEKFDSIKHTFAAKMKTGDLPEAAVIQRYEPEKKETSLDKARKLFGDALQVVEGDENGSE